MSWVLLNATVTPLAEIASHFLFPPTLSPSPQALNHDTQILTVAVIFSPLYLLPVGQRL